MSLLAQVTTDAQRPFDQGRTIELPATSEYLGDLPQEIEWSTVSEPYHTVEGLLAQHVGWAGQGTSSPLGTNNGNPGVLFEGIPYPFSSSGILNWLPGVPNLELLNFPTAAWWGPTAATGAVQIRLPEAPSTPTGMLGLWGGSGGVGGGEGSYQGTDFSVGANTQHGYFNGATPTDSFNLISGMHWVSGSPFDIQSGFLGAQWIGSDNWYSFFTSLKWKSPNFQTAELKPFFQSTRLNGLNLQEYGSHLNYHFNMAGLAESQWGLGFRHDDFSQGVNTSSLNKAFFQNSEILNVFESFSLNFALRWDFSSVSNTSFSTLVGGQYTMNDFQLLANYAKGVDPSSSLDVQRMDLGVRAQPNEEWFLSCKYVYEQVGSGAWNGGRAEIQWAPGGTTLLLLHDVRLKADEQILQNSAGQIFGDTGGRVSWSFFQPVTLWVGGRGISGRIFYGDAGIDCFIKDWARIFISAENATNPPVSWPDLTVPSGTVYWAGMEARL